MRRNVEMLFQRGVLTREEASTILDFPGRDKSGGRELLAFYEATELLPDGTRRWKELGE